MSGNDLNLAVRITLDGKQFKAGVDLSRDQIRALAGTINQGAEEAKNKFAATRQGLVSISGQLRELRNAALAFFGVAGTQQFVSAIYQANIQAQKLRNTLDFAAGSQIGGAGALEYLRDAANRLGLEVRSAGTAFAGLSAAARGTALAGQPVRDVFESVAGASTVMGLSAEDTKGALLALQQMMSKGTVQAEELRGQLGERIPGAFAIAARAMGKTEIEFNKLLETGQVMSDEFLPKFAAELQRTIAGDLPAATRSMQAEMNRMKNAWDLLLQSFASNGGMQVAADGARALANGFKIVSDNIDAVKNAGASIAETVAVGAAVLGAARLIALARAFDLAAISALALTSNPLVLAFSTALAAGLYVANQRADELNENLNRLQKEADDNRDVISSLGKALDRVASQGGSADYIRQLSYLYRTNAISGKEAAEAANAYAQSLETVAAAEQKAAAVMSANAEKQGQLATTIIDERNRRLLSATDFAIYEANREAAKRRDIATGNAGLLATIEEELQIKIKAIRDKAEAEDKARLAGQLQAQSANAAARAAIETSAAEKIAQANIAAAARVAQVWSQANADLAAQTGGQIVNLGTPGEFVSSWTADGKYVGQLAGGGPVRGPGTATSDSILARLSNGEYVLRAAAVRRVGVRVLDAINSGSVPKFADGGRVGGTSAVPSAASITIQNVNLPSVTNARQLVAELKQMLRTDPKLLDNGLARAG